MNNSSPERIGVIGAGLAGLASACTLAARGCKVVLFERNEWLGVEPDAEPAADDRSA